jgi:predicted RND superfamily exporter protein
MTWYRFGEWIIERRFRVLLVLGALTVFFGYFAAQTQLVTSFGDLLPKNHPFIKTYQKYEEFFGGTNNVTIMVEAREGTIYTHDIIAKIAPMTRDMDLVYGVQHYTVRSLTNASFFRPVCGELQLSRGEGSLKQATAVLLPAV